jgi:hypothetical protein
VFEGSFPPFYRRIDVEFVPLIFRSNVVDGLILHIFEKILGLFNQLLLPLLVFSFQEVPFIHILTLQGLDQLFLDIFPLFVILKNLFCVVEKRNP